LLNEPSLDLDAPSSELDTSTFLLGEPSLQAWRPDLFVGLDTSNIDESRSELDEPSLDLHAPSSELGTSTFLLGPPN
jgi:hypothetical protein